MIKRGKMLKEPNEDMEKFCNDILSLTKDMLTLVNNFNKKYSYNFDDVFPLRMMANLPRYILLKASEIHAHTRRTKAKLNNYELVEDLEQ